jgi:hypothetical protein
MTGRRLSLAGELLDVTPLLGDDVEVPYVHHGGGCGGRGLLSG